jgi:hypothetical protein
MRAVIVVLTLVSSAAVALPAAPATAAVTLCDGKVVTVIGTPGDDILRGTPDGDVIAGLGGDDAILAGAGDDVICGGDGADRLYGDPGDDVLFAGKAGRIDDRFRPDLIDGGPGDDRLEIGREKATLRSGVSGVIRFGTATDGVVVDLAERSAAGDGNDTVIPRPGLRLIGTPDDDVLSGSEFGEVIKGFGGSDTIMGYAGDDRLFGDDITSTTGGSDDDRISGGGGKDVVIGRIGADVLRGGADPDQIQARGTGPNRVFGGTGDDFFEIVLGSTPGVVVTGGEGRDDVTLDVTPATPRETAVVIRMIPGEIVLGGTVIGENDRVERVRAAAWVPLVYRGTTGPDTVFAGSHGVLRAATWGGNDVIRGSDQPDHVDAGRGTDEVRARAGRDICLHAEVRRSCEILSP